MLRKPRRRLDYRIHKPIASNNQPRRRVGHFIFGYKTLPLVSYLENGTAPVSKATTIMTIEDMIDGNSAFLVSSPKVTLLRPISR